MKKFLIVLFLAFAGQSFGNETIAKTILKEWKTFRSQVDVLEPHGDIGGYMLYRDYQDMTLLWLTSPDANDNEVIRFFMERTNGDIFAVTYHRSHIIVPGRVVLRRFVGREPTGWINHTIDMNTGDYLGSQGQKPELTASEKKMMKEWGIHNF